MKIITVHWLLIWKMLIGIKWETNIVEKIINGQFIFELSKQPQLRSRFPLLIVIFPFICLHFHLNVLWFDFRFISYFIRNFCYVKCLKSVSKAFVTKFHELIVINKQKFIFLIFFKNQKCLQTVKSY